MYVLIYINLVYILIYILILAILQSIQFYYDIFTCII